MKKAFSILIVGLLLFGAIPVCAEEEKVDFVGATVENEDIKKSAVKTLNDINVKGNSGPIELNIRSLEVQDVTVKNQAAAESVDVEANRPYAFITVYVVVENTSDNDVSFLPTAAQIVTEAKEQVRCSMMMSDHFDSTYYGNVQQEGYMSFALPKSAPQDIKTLTFVFEGAFDKTETNSYDGFKLTVDIPSEEDDS